MEEEGFFVLIVENDIDDIQVLEFLLKQHFPTWKYYCVLNGQLAIDFLKYRSEKEFPVSFVLSDINMPVKDGFNTLVDLRASNEYKNLPFVGFSTTYHLPMVERFLQLGGTAYFQKPESMDEMIQIIGKLPSFVNNSTIRQ